ncbi:MAG: outer membrane protein [Bosea sp. (in: a-proteobacteria)]
MRFHLAITTILISTAAGLGVVQAQQSQRAGNWQGVYVGGHAGASIGSASSANTSGFNAGVQIGVNGQFDKIVAGVEADVSATSNGNTGFGTKFRQGTNGSMRGRVGYSFDRVMVYGTAGVAVSNYEYKSPVASTSRMRTGSVFGAGAELMLTDNVSVRGEVLRYNYANSSFLNVGGSTNVAPTNNVLRDGMNYRF